MGNAPDAVRRLVDRFDQNRDAYHSVSYNEAQLRREFIDPLFEALGWDVENRQGSAMPYRDVIFEDSLKVGGAPARALDKRLPPTYNLACAETTLPGLDGDTGRNQRPQ
jgi:hypothetical protein